MFTITFEGEHKSLSSFTSEALNDFTVITGENGSGKSQLIELIQLMDERNFYKGQSFSFSPSIKRIRIGGIEASSFSSIGSDAWRNKIKSFYTDYYLTKIETRKFIWELLKHNVWINDLTREFIHANKLIDQALKCSKENFPDSVANQEIDFFLQGLKQIPGISSNRPFLVAKYVSEFHNMPFEMLDEVIFYNTIYDESAFGKKQLFNPQLEDTFYTYARMRHANSYSYFEKKENNRNNNSISNAEFDAKYPPPWEKINSILQTHNLNFKFIGIERENFHPDAGTTFRFVKTTDNQNIRFQDLSSGEKTIIGLIISLFVSQHDTRNLDFPELIVLDEPDAYLHPKMCKLLVDVLHETFVKELKIKVIMTTHSPSTIALCPEESIYQLNNHTATTLKKIEKDAALELLTGFIPTLSIDYKNHRQVFVESTTDVYYYQTIFNKLHSYYNYTHNLYFIANTMGDGNCELVRSTVQSMRVSGNKTSYGIIDWDLKNKSSDFVKVHGEEERYNIENFVYDPIYIAVLFMNTGLEGAQGIYQEIGKDTSYNPYSIGEESDEFLQSIVNWFFEKYYSRYTVSADEKNDHVLIEYFNGRQVHFPKWFLHFNGHDFERRLKSIFNVLENKYRDEGKLQKELSLVIAKCYPFIPKASVKVIEELMKG